MRYSLWSVQQNIVRFSHHYVVYGLGHFCCNRHFMSLGNDGFSLVMFGTKVSDSKIFYKIFTSKAKEENQTSNNYWSSTTNASNTNNAWNVIVVYTLGCNFNNGNTNNNNKSNSKYVRCVRAG